VNPTPQGTEAFIAALKSEIGGLRAQGEEASRELRCARDRIEDLTILKDTYKQQAGVGGSGLHHTRDEPNLNAQLGVAWKVGDALCHSPAYPPSSDMPSQLQIETANTFQ